MNDLKFYVDLSERVSSKKSVPGLLKKLSELKESSNISFKPKIPQYTQTQLSCGATCLANVVGTYFPHIHVDRALENGIHKLVTVPGFYNNLPSSLACVSREKFGIPAHFFADFDSFAPLFLETRASEQPLKKFQDDYERVKGSSLDYNEITPDKLKEKLKKGHFVSFVTGEGPMLHYKMIVGYNNRGDNQNFYIFDPQSGIRKMEETAAIKHMRNDKSLWGVEYVPPESVIFPQTQRSLSKAKELLSWKTQ